MNNNINNNMSTMETICSTKAPIGMIIGYGYSESLAPYWDIVDWYKVVSEEEALQREPGIANADWYTRLSKFKKPIQFLIEVKRNEDWTFTDALKNKVWNASSPYEVVIGQEPFTLSTLSESYNIT